MRTPLLAGAVVAVVSPVPLVGAGASTSDAPAVLLATAGGVTVVDAAALLLAPNLAEQPESNDTAYGMQFTSGTNRDRR